MIGFERLKEYLFIRHRPQNVYADVKAGGDGLGFPGNKQILLNA